MSGEEQRLIGAVYISAFLEATLKGRWEYVRLFRDHRSAGEWLPDALLVSRFEDPSFRLVSDFEEDVDVTTASVRGGRIEGKHLVVWRESDLKLRGGGHRYDNGVFLGWTSDGEKEAAREVEAGSESGGNGESESASDSETAAIDSSRAAESSQETQVASYDITLPDSLARDWQLSADKVLVFNLAEADEKAEAKDYSVTKNENESDAVDGETAENGEGAETNERTDDEEEGDEEEDDEADEDDDRPPLDLSVELVTAEGVAARLPLSRFGFIVPPLEVKFTRSKLLEKRYKSAVEPVLQAFELPLAAFAAAEPAFRPAELAKIRFVFDRAPKGVIILDRVGFAAAVEEG